jgi:LAGLIDADG DNA endonuclease family
LEQNYLDKENYLMNLFELYKLLVTNYPRVIEIKPDIITEKVYKSIYFKTYSFNCFNYYHDLFYLNKMKIVPKNIQNLLTAKDLAYWIMDGGGKLKHGQMILHSRAFIKKRYYYLKIL